MTYLIELLLKLYKHHIFWPNDAYILYYYIVNIVQKW